MIQHPCDRSCRTFRIQPQRLPQILRLQHLGCGPEAQHPAPDLVELAGQQPQDHPPVRLLFQVLAGVPDPFSDV